jgi:ankyrin repeat protein
MTGETRELRALIRAIVADQADEVRVMLSAAPKLARVRVAVGATRQGASGYFFPEIAHYLYSGDTALHAAAAGYRVEIARELVKQGADVAARNRRGAQPLHYAADGGPGSQNWNPEAQAATISCLIEAGADVNAQNLDGATALHRAVRGRCSRAVEALLRGGADVRVKNKSGSTPIDLTVWTTGRGGAGSEEAKQELREIMRMLQIIRTEFEQ